MTDDSVMTFKQFCHGYVRYKDAARRIVRQRITGDMKWKRDADNFMNAVAEGRLQPVGHSSNKATSTKWYSVVDIRALRAAENIKAEIQSKQL